MIKREAYMKKIRPFINSDLVKVLTGIRRCGKSVMLDLIKQELLQQISLKLSKKQKQEKSNIVWTKPTSFTA